MSSESMEEAETIELNVNGLYDVWESMQKDNIHKPNKWVKVLENGEYTPHIIVTNGDTGVRVPDGRHRLSAHKECGKATIRALATAEARQIKEMYGL